MAEQPGSGALSGAAGGTAAPGTAASPAGPAEHAGAVLHESFHGKPVSWVAVTIIVAGFIVGAAGMIPHMTWWLFWTGVGIAVVGACIGGLTKIMEDWY